MAPGLGIVTLLCLGVGLLLTTVAVIIPYWERSDPDQTLNDFNIRHIGLWLRCTSYMTGHWECDNYNKFFLALSAKVQAARGFGIVSILSGALACFLLCFAIQEGTCGNLSIYRMKRIRYVVGALAFLSSVCILAAASWYAHDLHQEYNYSMMSSMTRGIDSGQRLVFGVALFVAWAGGAMFLIGGILASYMGCQDVEDPRTPYEHRMETPYVYRNEVNTITGSKSEYV